MMSRRCLHLRIFSMGARCYLLRPSAEPGRKRKSRQRKPWLRSWPMQACETQGTPWGRSRIRGSTIDHRPNWGVGSLACRSQASIGWPFDMGSRAVMAHPILASNDAKTSSKRRRTRSVETARHRIAAEGCSVHSPGPRTQLVAKGVDHDPADGQHPANYRRYIPSISAANRFARLRRFSFSVGVSMVFSTVHGSAVSHTARGCA